MKRNVTFVLMAAVLCIGVLSHAGSKVVLPVLVQTFSSGYSEVSGSLGSARNSSDATQYIGCIITTYDTGSSSVLCSGMEADGTYGSCTSSAPALVEAARALGTEGYLRVRWTTSTGKCTMISVDLYSDTEPKH